MKNWIVLVLSVPLFAMTPAGCSAGSNMEGTYTSALGNVVLDLKSGGKATFTLMGESMPCTYKVKDEKLSLDCTPQGKKWILSSMATGPSPGPVSSAA